MVIANHQQIKGKAVVAVCMCYVIATKVNF